MESRKWYSKSEILKRRQEYVDSIDQYTDYIDSFEQKQIADKNNDYLRGLINFCDNVIRELDDIVEKLKEQRIITTVEYSKGYFRIERDKHYYIKLKGR